MYRPSEAYTVGRRWSWPTGHYLVDIELNSGKYQPRGANPFNQKDIVCGLILVQLVAIIPNPPLITFSGPRTMTH